MCVDGLDTGEDSRYIVLLHTKQEHSKGGFSGLSFDINQLFPTSFGMTPICLLLSFLSYPKILYCLEILKELKGIWGLRVL